METCGDREYTLITLKPASDWPYWFSGFVDSLSELGGVLVAFLDLIGESGGVGGVRMMPGIILPSTCGPEQCQQCMHDYIPLSCGSRRTITCLLLLVFIASLIVACFWRSATSHVRTLIRRCHFYKSLPFCISSLEAPVASVTIDTVWCTTNFYFLFGKVY